MQGFASQWLFTFKIILQRGKQVTNHRHTPGATQDFLPLHPAHVVHVSVVFGETKNPKKGDHMENVIFYTHKAIMLKILSWCKFFLIWFYHTPVRDCKSKYRLTEKKTLTVHSAQ